MPERTQPARLVLGSRSPRRRELLGLVAPTVRIEIVPPRSPDEAGFEGLLDRSSIERRLREIARAKCDDVLDQLRSRPDFSDIGAVITADTTIVAEGPDGRPAVLGQPPEDETWTATVAEWFRRYYAGRTHDVLTALCVAVPVGRRTERLASTAVTFTEDVESRLAWYLATGEPRGKAGGYAIQGAADVFVTDVQGSISNVVGLPLRELLEAFEELHVAVPAGGR